MELQWRPRTRHPSSDTLSRSHGNKTRGATVDGSFPVDDTTKRIYRGLQSPVLDGVPLGELGIEGINNNSALPLTILAAVTFTPDLPPVDTNPVGYRSRANSLDSASILPKAVVIGCGVESSIRALDAIFEFTGVTDHKTNLSRRSGVRFLGEVSQTRSNHWENIQKDKRAGGRATRHGRSSHHHCSSLYFLSSSPPDAGKHTVPPQVGNLDSRSLTTPHDHRLLLENG